MKDITLMGATYQDVPAVLLPQSGGGTARFDDCSVVTAAAADVASGKIFVASDGTITTGTASGGGLQYIDSLYSATIALKNTGYATWTPSTTATAIVAAGAVCSQTFTATNVNLNDYYSRFLVEINIAYTNTTAAKGRFLRTVADNWYVITKRPSNLANMNSGTRNAVVAEAMSNMWGVYYYSSATATAFSWAQSYGFYTGNGAPTSSGNVDSPVITVKNPVINARCNATYFATGQASLVDQENSTIKIKHELYKALSPYNRQKSYLSMVDIWQNGLTI